MLDDLRENELKALTILSRFISSETLHNASSKRWGKPRPTTSEIHELLHLGLEGGYHLHSRRALNSKKNIMPRNEKRNKYRSYHADDTNALVSPVPYSFFPSTIAFGDIPSRSMYDATLEIGEAFDVRPLPPVQCSGCSEKYIGDNLYFFKLGFGFIAAGCICKRTADGQMPFSRRLVVSSMHKSVLEFDVSCEVILFYQTSNIV